MYEMNPTDISQNRQRKYHIKFRTIFLPLLFMGLHWVVINLAAVGYMVAFVMLRTPGSATDPWHVFSDQDILNQVLIEQYPIITIFYSLALIPIYIIFLIISRGRDKRILLSEPLKATHLWPSIAIIIGAMGLTQLWFMLLNVLSERIGYIDAKMQDYIEQSEAFAPTAGYIWLILGIVILAPIAEELLFRGIIQGELRKAMPEWLAVIIQAILFAAFHVQPIQVSYVIIPGLLLGMAYAWSRSIWVPIIMHIVFNFIGSVIPTLVGDDEILSMIVIFTQIAFIVIGTLAAVYFYMKRRKTAPGADQIYPLTEQV